MLLFHLWHQIPISSALKETSLLWFWKSFCCPILRPCAMPIYERVVSAIGPLNYHWHTFILCPHLFSVLVSLCGFHVHVRDQNLCWLCLWFCLPRISCLHSNGGPGRAGRVRGGEEKEERQFLYSQCFCDRLWSLKPKEPQESVFFPPLKPRNIFPDVRGLPKSFVIHQWRD